MMGKEQQYDATLVLHEIVQRVEQIRRWEKEEFERYMSDKANMRSGDSLPESESGSD